MFGASGRPVRIPPPPRRAGFKRRSDYYHTRGRPPPENLPSHLRLRGKPRTRALRRAMRTEAGMYRSPIRWILLLSLWSAVGWAMLANTFSRLSGLHFVAALSGVLAWFAAFSPSPATRLVTSVLLLVASLLGVLADQAASAAAAVGLGAFLLLAMARPDLSRELAEDVESVRR